MGTITISYDERLRCPSCRKCDCGWFVFLHLAICAACQHSWRPMQAIFQRLRLREPRRRKRSRR